MIVLQASSVALDNEGVCVWHGFFQISAADECVHFPVAGLNPCCYHLPKFMQLSPLLCDFILSGSFYLLLTRACVRDLNHTVYTVLYSTVQYSVYRVQLHTSYICILTVKREASGLAAER